MKLPSCVVTVYCLAYNHEKYIKKTLQGFVEQRTSFPFRVIVHDDASTDSTKSIIEEYARNYPTLFFPIFQTENQHSGMFRKFIYPLIESKYIACCEGDDYWCNTDKLQKQFDYMESHPTCTLCVHNSRIILENGQATDRWFNYSLSDKDYSVDDVIRAKGGGLFHTSSFFYRLENALLPEAFYIKGIGDYNMSIYLASIGYVHYLADVMSCYRTGSINSWVKNVHDNRQRIVDFNKRLVEGLKRIGDSLEEDHKSAIEYAIRQYTLDNYLYMNRKWRVLLSPYYWKSFVEMEVKVNIIRLKRMRFLRNLEEVGDNLER